MKLTTAQIRSLLFGAVTVAEEADGLRVGKCSDAVLEVWGTLSNVLKQRAMAPSGVRLDFETDSEEVTFSLKGTQFDLLVDGLLADRFFGSQETEDFSVTLDGGMHRLTLIFPSHECTYCRVVGLELTDGASVTPHEYDCKFLFLGDSITQGWNSDLDSLSYAWRTSLHFNADSIIYGVGGAYFCKDTFEVPQGFAPDRVFVAFGTNDFNFFKTPESLRENAAAYLDRVTEAFGAEKILGITPIWRYDTWVNSMGTFDECIDIIREEYEKRGIATVDGLSLVPNRKEFFSDVVHPNAIGFSMYAENLIRVLEGDGE